MTNKSPAELERDAERVRTELANTTEQLREKMTPGQLMDEVVGYFKEGDTNQLLVNLKHQVRDNPLALALVGGGLAWLMMGNGSANGHGEHAVTRQRPDRNGSGSPLYARPAGSVGLGEAATGSSRTGNSASALTGAVGQGASAAADAVKGAAGSVGDAASAVGNSLASGLHGLQAGASSGAAHAADAGAQLGARVKSTFLDTLEREPLVIGALGVAVGTAIGAMLPASRTEQEYLGPMGKQVQDAAQSAWSEGMEKARHVAEDAYAAAREEADRQGLTDSGKPVSQKLADVAGAAGAEVKSAAQEGLRQAEERLEPKRSSEDLPRRFP